MGTLFSGDILEKDANTSATNHKIDQENQVCKIDKLKLPDV